MHNKRIGIFLTIFIMIVMFNFGYYLFGIFNGLGDEELTSSSIDIHKYLNFLVGFPTSIFKNGFPFFLPNSELWKVSNVLLQLFNIFVQSALILALYNYFTTRRKK